MEEQELLKMALGEIQQLRHENQIMRARLQMFDSMMSVFNADPGGDRIGGMHPDIVHELQKRLEIIKTD